MPYERLFSGFGLRQVELRNRIAVLPYGTAMVENGAPTAGDIAHYESIARSGPALMFSGATVMHPSTATRSRILVEAYNEQIIGDLSKKADALHRHGVVLFGQLVHLGREWPVGDRDFPPMAPSAVRLSRNPYLPHEMDVGEIATIVDAFGRSARNLQLAGYDGIEIHAAHGYLVAQFLSPASNKRLDAYGGSADKRLRFLREVIDSIRNYCGEDILLSVRLSADEELADGLEVPDTIQIAKALEAHKATDLLNITLGTRGAYVKDMTVPDAVAANAALAIKRATALPVLVGQRISTPEVAEQILADGAADLIGMARAFIADPAWISKAAAGEARRIRPCLNFNQDCRDFAPHLHCGVNPATGRETQALFKELTPATKVKRVAVIGGGPGGLEAALTAALRGHEVCVFEATSSFGGQFLYAASIPRRQRLARLVDFQLSELRRLGVALHTGAKIESTRDLDGSFDAAVVATGASARPLNDALAAAGGWSWFDILEQGAPQPSGSGRAIFVDDGSGFWWNYGVAEALVVAGWQLTLATPSAAVAHMIPHESVGPLLARLGAGNSQFRILTTLESILAEGARLVSLISGEEFIQPCDLVVIQTGRVPVVGPGAALREGGIREVHVIGDCVSPRRASIAVLEAQRVARSL